MNTKQEDVKATPQGNGGVRVTTLGASLHKIVRDYEMGLKLLPDVKDFSISLGAENELFQQIGIKIKDKPKLKFKPWKNKKANRFVV